MEDLPGQLLAEIIKRIPSTSDLNSLSLVSKRLYTIEAEHRADIRVGCGLSPASSAMASLCSRFRGQLDNQGLHVLSSSCPLLNDLTLIYCSNIDDSGLAYIACCKELVSLRLHAVPGISSSGILSVAVGCKRLCTLNLICCENVSGTEWLEYLGKAESLEELVLRLCNGTSQYDLLKFGPGWMRLQRFEFEGTRNYRVLEPRDPSDVSHCQYKYDFCCENMKSLRLAHIITKAEIGLRFLLGKCRALEWLCLHLVTGLQDSDMIALSQSCSNLRSIKLVLTPLMCRSSFSTPLTDHSLKALAVGCPKLQDIDLAFAGCDPSWPCEIGFTQEGLVTLVKSCPIRVLVLTGANFFNDEGMEALASAQFLKTLELMRCVAVTNVGLLSVARTPCLINLTLRECQRVSDSGVAKLVHAKKLDSLIIEGCRGISRQAVQGAARSVHYSVEAPSVYNLRRC
ncbi:hypothetical protein ACP70R_018403 [Stipagrostis hirtigluma subsp. patula]